MTAHSPLAMSPGWHFPGPSSKYHQREKSRSEHTRFTGAFTTPVAPTFHTDRRVHRRAQSVLSPPTSSDGISTRSPLSRFSSYTSTAMASNAPYTPVKTPRRESLLQDSPFSDYFTDDARSTTHDEHTYNAPSAESQRLLLRMNNLASQLMRDDNASEAMSVMARKIGELEHELNALHSQTRLPAEMEDSGLFMDDDEQDEPKEETRNGTTTSASFPQVHGAYDEPEREKESQHTDNAELLAEAHKVLQSVTVAHEELRKRHTELRDLNDIHILKIEDREREVESLRSENEALKSDLGFDHSEILFLKLQMKALEVQIDSLDDVEDLALAKEAQEGIKRVKRGMVLEEMDRWKSDWQDVDSRFRRRRSKYGVLSASGRDTNLEKELEACEDEEENWRLETVKQGKGRVSSITIRRLSRSTNDYGLDGAEDDGEARTQSVKEFAAERKAAYCEAGTQTDEPSRPSPEFQFEDSSYSIGKTYEDDEDDFAITSSSEDGVEAPKLEEKPEKSAWQELCEGLSALAGLGED